MQGPLDFHPSGKDEWQHMYAVIVDYTLAYYKNKQDLLSQERPIQVIPLDNTHIKEIKQKSQNTKYKCRFSVNHDKVCIKSIYVPTCTISTNT